MAHSQRGERSEARKKLDLDLTILVFRKFFDFDISPFFMILSIYDVHAYAHAAARNDNFEFMAVWLTLLQNDLQDGRHFLNGQSSLQSVVQQSIKAVLIVQVRTGLNFQSLTDSSISWSSVETTTNKKKQQSSY